MIQIPTPWGTLIFVVSSEPVKQVTIPHGHCACKTCSIGSIRNTYARQGYRLSNRV